MFLSFSLDNKLSYLNSVWAAQFWVTLTQPPYMLAWRILVLRHLLFPARQEDTGLLLTDRKFIAQYAESIFQQEQEGSSKKIGSCPKELEYQDKVLSYLINPRKGLVL